jgi:hypothetical protein
MWIVVTACRLYSATFAKLNILCVCWAERAGDKLMRVANGPL